MNIELQDFLFSSPTRKQLLEYVPTLSNEYVVQVFRNHSFEFIEHTIHPYLEYGQLGVKFTYSGYDDTLTFNELNCEANALILWLDSRRYHSQEQFEKFITSRMIYLRSIYTKPVLLVVAGMDVKAESASMLTFSLQGLEMQMGTCFWDERASAITGTSLSRKAMMAIARELGLRYIPALLCPALKAVVVDFDNTLYNGVLGEDGIWGVQVTEGHYRLQKQLKELSNRGVMLCAASKNELEDVEKLLNEREDFPLDTGDFAKLCVSWQPKSQSIQEIANYLNIGVDSILFIDDNIGELRSVTMAFPQIKAILAKEDANITTEILENYPGLFIVSNSSTGFCRKEDIIANEKRKELMDQVSNKSDYIRSLGISLEFQRDNTSVAKRISELANKTNQFIFNYQRYTEAEIMHLMERTESTVVSVSLSDMLSDSGLIAVCVGRRLEKNICVLEECFMSCRAMGRGIEDIIILGAVQKVLEYLDCDKLRICFQDGPRNAPAKKFVQDYLEHYLNDSDRFSYQVPKNLVNVNYMEGK